MKSIKEIFEKFEKMKCKDCKKEFLLDITKPPSEQGLPNHRVYLGRKYQLEHIPTEIEEDITDDMIERWGML